MLNQIKFFEKLLDFTSHLSFGRFFVLLVFMFASLIIWHTESLKVILDFVS